MSVLETIDIPPMSARAFTLRAGHKVRVCDVEGGQPGDLAASVALPQAASSGRTPCRRA